MGNTRAKNGPASGGALAFCVVLGDAETDGHIAIDDLLMAVDYAMNGCAG